ncbi:MAG: hypothetical protein A2Y98_01245 [Candidatus Portnoybacteria bacterium RBG_19FT_COMBO_36_7]|uniref:Aminoacyl-transfer RNA synthetases class-II family profile domain-containing protein n=1 Tax=Candidatus Portnoybacteria bacterium RBG_19FT_COMBO_36_7 TaxID=1801992 RepID=A0A1G2F6Y5_9BACT|nr:MAG: hypothetical protein A2Y98_01245 [Candidatus Portnoybacteria bacterium RBG_19FT_COMBO_36_7]
MIGKFDELVPIIEDYIKHLSAAILLMRNIVDKISGDPTKTKAMMIKIIKTDRFPEISFDEATNILIKNKGENYVNITRHGKDISCQGEIEIMKALKVDTPLWIRYFDRDRVPFYQKPDPKSPNKTINADLLFPPIVKNSFGGEIVGSGQRQDSPREIHESLKRQNNISPKPYEWYINLRKLPGYKTTSGFGLGIERFIAWALAKQNIRDVILYPRIKNVETYP